MSETKEGEVDNKSKEISISGLPDGCKIADFPGDPNPNLMEDFRYLLESDRWKLKVDERGGQLEVDIRPVETSTTKTLQDGSVIDLNLARVRNGSVELLENTNYASKPPVESEAGMVYRGISTGEMNSILETGEIKTAGSAVKNIPGHEELTFFTPNLQEAINYAAHGGRVQAARWPTFGEPNYVIGIRKPENIDFEGDNEIGVKDKIPGDEILSITEVRPYSIKPGKMPLKRQGDHVRPAQGLAAHFNPVKIKAAYRATDIEGLRSDRQMVTSSDKMGGDGGN